ncbi:hypothetical protein K443DRAFT_686468 [Laccaria amethystina LaAM-08-1]|uniref:Uncharacterized protein n=1 Tax=Laccaria amethystina LaAM-08-1 TaxID=1095629 RepID=A0A0C9X2N1_9AGAR|nr:hypothetical protein K443DRAFT_686468 [Laccaria amethystina LaAM-08-1]
MASGTYYIQASNDVGFSVSRKLIVVLALNRVRSPSSCNTFLPVNYCQVTRDRRQTETRF